jgi:hypothetical protein
MFLGPNSRYRLWMVSSRTTIAHALLLVSGVDSLQKTISDDGWMDPLLRINNIHDLPKMTWVKTVKNQ